MNSSVAEALLLDLSAGFITAVSLTRVCVRLHLHWISGSCRAVAQRIAHWPNVLLEWCLLLCILFSGERLGKATFDHFITSTVCCFPSDLAVVCYPVTVRVDVATGKGSERLLCIRLHQG
jgi:hypothetical protein